MVTQWDGPTKLLRDSNGRVVITFGQFPNCRELSPDHTASAIGWGSGLIASSPSLETLSEAVERRFKGRVAVAVGETVNPRNWPVARWGA